MKIYKQTSGDWFAIQDDSGGWFRLTGPKQVVLANQLQAVLFDVKPDPSLLQDVGLLEIDDAPFIVEIVSERGNAAFRAHADSGAELLLQPSEVKMLLSK